MGLSRYANQRDDNEALIFEALRRVGASVYPTNGPGDCLCGYRKRTFILEIKLPPGPKGGLSHSKQTKPQIEFQRTWRGQYAVVRTPREALIAIGARFGSDLEVP